MKTTLKTFTAALLTALFATSANNVSACAACYGKSDSAMAQGMNWGIMVLLGVIVMVLTGITTFFVYIAKKTAKSDNA